jgi:hypothetical protein
MGLMHTLGMAAGLVGLFFSGFLAGSSHERLKKIDLRRSPGHWLQLPSGWSKDYGSLTIYAMTQGAEAYWWVSRNGKTIIEGPAGTLTDAKLEAEHEARELSP